MGLGVSRTNFRLSLLALRSIQQKYVYKNIKEHLDIQKRTRALSIFCWSREV